MWLAARLRQDLYRRAPTGPIYLTRDIGQLAPFRHAFETAFLPSSPTAGVIDSCSDEKLRSGYKRPTMATSTEGRSPLCIVVCPDSRSIR